MRALSRFRHAPLIVFGLAGASWSAVAQAEEIAACDPIAAPRKCSEIVGTITKTLDGDAGFVTKVDTGWYPKDAAADGHGDKAFQVRTSSALDDSKITVALTTDWVARWGSGEAGLAKGRVRIGPRNASSKGEIKVVYKLYPTLSLYVNAAGFKGEIAIASTDLANISAGSVTGGEFNYAPTCTKTYAPWSFGTASAPCQVKDDFANGGTLLSIDPTSVVGMKGATPVQLEGLSAVVKLTTQAGFTWETSELSVTGGSRVLDATNGVLDVPYEGGSSVALATQAKGTIAYKGASNLVQTVKLFKLDGVAVNLDIPINAGAVPVALEEKLPPTTLSSTITIPVPNVQPLTTPISFGVVAPGERKKIKVTLPNSGKAAGYVQAITSDPAHFSVDLAAVSVPAEGAAELTVEVASDQPGPLAGKLILATNNVIDDPIEISLSGSISGAGQGGGGGASGAAGAASGGQAGAAGVTSAGGQAGASGSGQAGAAGTSSGAAGQAGAAGSGQIGTAGTSSGAAGQPGSAGSAQAGAPSSSAGAAGVGGRGGASGASPAAASGAASPGDDGGCAASGRGASGSSAAVLAAIAALSMRRRRAAAVAS